MIRLASSTDLHAASASVQDFATLSAQNGLAPAALTSKIPAVTSPRSHPPVTSLAFAPLEGRLLDIAIDDWNELFRAVEARLKATVGTPLAPASEAFKAKPDDIGLKVQHVVLECVAALGQLHTALTHERSLRHELEMEVLDAQTALAQALSENLGAQAAKVQARDSQLFGHQSNLNIADMDIKSDSLPSSREFAAMLLAFKTTGGALRSDELSRLLEQRKKGDQVRLAKLVGSRELCSFEWHCKCWVPMFQFEPGDLSMRPGPRQVIFELGGFRQGWALAKWFVQPNAALNGRLPIDLMQSDLDDVLAAARSDRCAETH